MSFVHSNDVDASDRLVVYENQHFREEPYLSEDDFGFDFSDDLSVRSEVIFSVVSTSPSVSSVKEEPDTKPQVIKAETTRKRGSKFMRKAAAPETQCKKLQPIPTSTGVRKSHPNMSRRTRDTMLYVFPSFDRCDSLLFFPSTLARHMNSGDVPAVAKLFLSHFDKHCTIVGKAAPSEGLNIQALTQKMQLMEEMQPDRITCFRSTQVDGNVIKATGYMKFTKCRTIYDAVARMKNHTKDSMCFKHTWQEHMRSKIEKDDRPQEEKDRFLALIERDCDLVVYSKMELELTVCDMTKKVKYFNVNITMTNMEEANYDTNSLV